MVVNTPGQCLGNPFPPNSSYDMSFDGTVTETNRSSGATFSSTSDTDINFSIQSNGTVRMSLMGTGTASCIDGSATFNTTEDLVIPPNSECPASGRLRVEIAGEGAHEVIYSGSGVQIDLGAPTAASIGSSTAARIRPSNSAGPSRSEPPTSLEVSPGSACRSGAFFLRSAEPCRLVLEPQGAMLE